MHLPFVIARLAPLAHFSLDIRVTCPYYFRCDSSVALRLAG
jgi:hypothetical protein